MQSYLNFKFLMLPTLTLGLAVPLGGCVNEKSSDVLQSSQLREQSVIQLKTVDSLRLSRDFSTLIEKSGYAKANVIYNEKIGNARTDMQRATIDLSYANSLARFAKRDNNPELLRTADEHYRFAIEKGTDRERLAAINNYATTALELGDSAKAVELFKNGYEQATALVNREVQARYYYNYGNALAKQGRLGDAFQKYITSYRSNPRDQGAASAALDVAIDKKDISAATEVVNEMIAQGHLSETNTALRRLLSETSMKSLKDFVAVIESLYKYLLIARVDEMTYKQHWSQFLESSVIDMHKWPQNYLNFVLKAYNKLSVTFDPYDVRREFAPWWKWRLYPSRAESELREPSRYFTGVGEIYAREGLQEQALARYMIAWGLDSSNLEAGQYAANLLYEYRKELDPDKRLLNRFVQRLFSGKGKAYLGEDWPMIFRFHSILASIYVRDKIWGDSNHARSAIFQLEHALMVRARIEDPEERNIAVPGLYSMLGQAYNGVDAKSMSFDNYLLAASEAMRLKDNEQAKSYLEEARDLNYRPSPSQLRNLQRMERRVG